MSSPSPPPSYITTSSVFYKKGESKILVADDGQRPRRGDSSDDYDDCCCDCTRPYLMPKISIVCECDKGPGTYIVKFPIRNDYGEGPVGPSFQGRIKGRLRWNSSTQRKMNMHTGRTPNPSGVWPSRIRPGWFEMPDNVGTIHETAHYNWVNENDPVFDANLKMHHPQNMNASYSYGNPFKPAHYNIADFITVTMHIDWRTDYKKSVPGALPYYSAGQDVNFCSPPPSDFDDVPVGHELKRSCYDSAYSYNLFWAIGGVAANTTPDYFAVGLHPMWQFMFRWNVLTGAGFDAHCDDTALNNNINVFCRFASGRRGTASDAMPGYYYVDGRYNSARGYCGYWQKSGARLAILSRSTGVDYGDGVGPRGLGDDERWDPWPDDNPDSAYGNETYSNPCLGDRSGKCNHRGGKIPGGNPSNFFNTADSDYYMTIYGAELWKMDNNRYFEPCSNHYCAAPIVRDYHGKNIDATAFYDCADIGGYQHGDNDGEKFPTAFFISKINNLCRADACEDALDYSNPMYPPQKTQAYHDMGCDCAGYWTGTGADCHADGPNPVPARRCYGPGHLPWLESMENQYNRGSENFRKCHDCNISQYNMPAYVSHKNTWMSPEGSFEMKGCHGGQNSRNNKQIVTSSIPSWDGRMGEFLKLVGYMSQTPTGALGGGPSYRTMYALGLSKSVDYRGGGDDVNSYGKMIEASDVVSTPFSQNTVCGGMTSQERTCMENADWKNMTCKDGEKPYSWTDVQTGKCPNCAGDFRQLPGDGVAQKSGGTAYWDLYAHPCWCENSVLNIHSRAGVDVVDDARIWHSYPNTDMLYSQWLAYFTGDNVATPLPVTRITSTCCNNSDLLADVIDNVKSFFENPEESKHTFEWAIRNYTEEMQGIFKCPGVHHDMLEYQASLMGYGHVSYVDENGVTQWPKRLNILLSSPVRPNGGSHTYKEGYGRENAREYFYGFFVKYAYDWMEENGGFITRDDASSFASSALSIWESYQVGVASNQWGWGQPDFQDKMAELMKSSGLDKVLFGATTTVGESKYGCWVPASSQGGMTPYTGWMDYAWKTDGVTIMNGKDSYVDFWFDFDGSDVGDDYVVFKFHAPWDYTKFAGYFKGLEKAYSNDWYEKACETVYTHPMERTGDELRDYGTWDYSDASFAIYVEPCTGVRDDDGDDSTDEYAWPFPKNDNWCGGWRPITSSFYKTALYPANTYDGYRIYENNAQGPNAQSLATCNHPIKNFAVAANSLPTLNPCACFPSGPPEPNAVPRLIKDTEGDQVGNEIIPDDFCCG